MSYRVETALSNRAGCQATECKNAGLKIDKNDLRFGVWIPFDDRGSWAWRHWGCVSGKQLANLRTYLEDPSQPGVYRWDYLDGYEGEEKNSLEKHPELQEKVRRVVTQGFIDPEDFNGDPEMNKLGESGLRTAESKRRMREQKKNRDHEIVELQEKLAAVMAERDALVARGASASKMEAQISGVKADLEQAEEEKKPATIKRVKGESDGEETKKPPKKKAKTKAKKEEDSEEEEKPLKKGRGKKGLKREYEESESEGEVIPVKKVRGKKAIKKEEDAEMANGDQDDFSAPQKCDARGKKIKEEANAQNGAKQETKSSKTAANRGRGKKAVKEEPIEESGVESTESPQEAPVKRGRGKKAIQEEEEAEDTPMTDAAPAKKPPRQERKKEEVSEDTPMLDAPTSPLTDVEEFQVIKAETDEAMRQVLSEQEIEKIKAEAEFAESRGDPLPAAHSAEEIAKSKSRKSSKGKKAAAPPRKGIDRRALSRGKTES